MKKHILTLATVVALCGCITFTSCIGSFNLSNKVLKWNQGLGNKFVNEVVFIAFCIVPVYEICMFADVVIFNTIEFWTGNNPVQAGLIQEIEGENGKYIVETLENGYKITNEEGQEMKLIYDVETNIWSSEIGENITKLVKIENNSAIVYLPNGEERSADLTADGVVSLRQVVEDSKFFAVK